jgi:hypothetical protein
MTTLLISIIIWTSFFIPAYYLFKAKEPTIFKGLTSSFNGYITLLLFAPVLLLIYAILNLSI